LTLSSSPGFFMPLADAATSAPELKHPLPDSSPAPPIEDLYSSDIRTHSVARPLLPTDRSSHQEVSIFLRLLDRWQTLDPFLQLDPLFCLTDLTDGFPRFVEDLFQSLVEHGADWSTLPAREVLSLQVQQCLVRGWNAKRFSTLLAAWLSLAREITNVHFRSESLAFYLSCSHVIGSFLVHILPLFPASNSRFIATS